MDIKVPDIKEKIKQLIQIRGPIMPSDINKAIGANLLMTSALLSELSSSNELKISNVKVGGSPLYYAPSQEHMLQNFSKNLHEKEIRAYNLLKEKKVLRDNELEPVVRVALRAIKDFAVPLNVNFKGSSEIFWKWFLLDKNETEKLIGIFLKPLPEKKNNEEKKRMATPQLKEPAIEMKEPKEQVIKKNEKTAGKTDNTNFYNEVLKYFNKTKIDIITKELEKKKELEFVVEIPSAVGLIKYFCKAKDKKGINDSDLASAYVKGQNKKLPVLFLATGDLTKKTAEMLEKDFKGLNFKKI